MRDSIVKTVYKVSDFLSWQRAKTLALSPSFQRRAVWSAAAKSYFIDTLARNLPIPVVFLRETTNLETLEPTREVVDGQQRLRTVLTYIEPESLNDYTDRDKFEVSALHNPEIAGKPFKTLKRDIKQTILNYQISVHILPSQTDDREVLQIFARMNSTGIKANRQELRNAQFLGQFKQTAYMLALEQLGRWRAWKVFKEDEIARMFEVEETSDLIIFMMYGVHGKAQDDIDKVYSDNEQLFSQNDEIVTRFRAVMEAIERTLGESLPQTVFSRRSLFHTLFNFYYDQIYSIGSKLESKRPRGISKAAISATHKVSKLIQAGEIDEEVTKSLRGATSDIGSRTTRLELMRQVMKGDKK